MLTFKGKKSCQKLWFCLLHLLEKREIKNSTPNEQASSDRGLTVPGKLDCIPISSPSPSEEQRGGFPPRCGALSDWMTTAANTTLIRTKNHRGRLCPWALYGNSDFSGSYVENIYQNSSYWSMPGEGGFLLNWCLRLTLIQPRHSLYYPLLYHLARVGTKSPSCSVRTPATNHPQAPHE